MLCSPDLSGSDFNEKVASPLPDDSTNPVLESASYIYNRFNAVTLNPAGIKAAAALIRNGMSKSSFTPASWRDQPLHFVPPVPYDKSSERTRQTLDWIFLISSLNFSFWSDRPPHERFGIEWRTGWAKDEPLVVHTGYWSLVAAVNRALEEGSQIINPQFYASATQCSDEKIAQMFRAAPASKEIMPLLAQRTKILRENGGLLCTFFGGSFQGFMDEFIRAYDGRGTALQMVKLVIETFPTFRDEVWLDGRKVCLWKRAQILVAEIWAAFYPTPESGLPHPFFPAGISDLTMFADYRVPQILHHLSVLTYSPALIAALSAETLLPAWSPLELSVRAASILAVEAIRDEIAKVQQTTASPIPGLSSVLIDFFLWDLAQRVDSGEEVIGNDPAAGPDDTANTSRAPYA